MYINYILPLQWTFFILAYPALITSFAYNNHICFCDTILPQVHMILLRLSKLMLHFLNTWVNDLGLSNTYTVPLILVTDMGLDILN